MKSARSLYAGVRMVDLDEREGWFSCTPMRHLRGFNWEAFPKVWRDQQKMRIPSTSTDAEWGALALKALSLSV